jgi:sulfite reductase (ferredoxin)
VGIEGKKIKHNGALVDAYYFCVGGSAGGNAAIARPVGYRCPATLVPESLERLLRAYLEDRYTSESLRTFLTRQSNDHLRALLAGEVTAPVERDQLAERVPIGVGE